MTEQSFKNHARLDAKFHFVYIPLALLCVIAAVLHVVQQPTPPNMLLVPVTVLLLFGGMITRMYALQVQDRMIRLEESLRLRSVGATPDGLSTRQLVALRFAPDAELATLAARAKAESLSSKQIKELIVQWRADHERV